MLSLSVYYEFVEVEGSGSYILNLYICIVTSSSILWYAYGMVFIYFICIVLYLFYLYCTVLILFVLYRIYFICIVLYLFYLYCIYLFYLHCILFFQLVTPFKPCSSVPLDTFDPDERFDCNVTFTGTNVIEGIRKLAEAGLADLPLPSHLRQIHLRGISKIKLKPKATGTLITSTRLS